MALRRTFPLDSKKLKARKRDTVLKSPLNWVALGGALLVPTLLNLGILGALIFVGATGLGLKKYWQGRHAQIEAEILSSLIEESNREQDAVLQKAMFDLKLKGRHNYAVTLGRFLLLKQTIEKRVHKDSFITEQKKKIENLVDEICFGVRDNIQTIVQIEEKTASILISSDANEFIETDDVRRKLLTQIINAYSSLNDTYENLEKLLEPGIELREPSESDPMDKVISRLKTENGIVRSVHKRLLVEMNESEVSAERAIAFDG